MATLEELNQALRLNREKYLLLQNRLRATLAPEVVSQYTVAEHQSVLASLYKESEGISKEYHCLNKRLARVGLQSRK